MKSQRRSTPPAGRRARASGSAKPPRPGGAQEEILALVKARPGIRPSEINRALRLQQSDAPRAALVKRGLIRKVRDGSAMRYYPV